MVGTGRLEQSWGLQRDGMMQNHVPWVQKGAINGEKEGGVMEHNGSDLLAVVTYSPWQHLKAAVKCQLVAMLWRVMRAPDPGVRLGHGLPGGEGTDLLLVPGALQRKPKHTCDMLSAPETWWFCFPGLSPLPSALLAMPG